MNFHPGCAVKELLAFAPLKCIELYPACDLDMGSSYPCGGATPDAPVCQCDSARAAEYFKTWSVSFATTPIWYGFLNTR